MLFLATLDGYDGEGRHPIVHIATEGDEEVIWG